MRGLVGVIAAAASALMGGCAAERVAGTKPATSPPASVVGACRFTVKAIDDLREDKSLGTADRPRIDGERFAGWFADGIAAVPGYSRDSAPIQLRIDVLKAYVHSLSTMKSVNLVVRVGIAANDRVPELRMYRGVDSSVNWSGSEAEIQDAFDKALADLKLQMAADIEKLCRR